MKVLGGLLLLAGAVARVESSCHPIPAIAWSGNQYFSDTHDTRTISFAGLASTLQQFLKIEKPEIVIMVQITSPEATTEFYETHINTFSPMLKRIVQEAGSSEIIPYVVPEEPQSFFSVIENFPYFSERLSQYPSLEALKDSLDENTGIFEDGQIQVVAASVPSAVESASLLADISYMANDKADGNYLVLVVHDASEQDCEPHKRRTTNAHRRLQTEDASSTGSEVETRYILITPDILSGVLVFLFFVSFVLMGLGCMNALSVPASFPKTAPAPGREY
uniref:Protein BIG1 n=1 Tax=Fibrocapsa japonica TaxID=94617 RepID=A0A7S2Y333_9STRA|mmetsp:Transcript_4068/g.6075  ORF Transcript_4068/g.6075 Transcript_4068/m.6075 type:complete len:278 (+) Transcript_4068:101-934(+)